MAKVWKLSIHTSDHFDIIVFYVLQILFLKDLR